MKLLALFLLGVVGMFAQALTTSPATTLVPTTPSAWAGFVAGGVLSGTSLTEGVGLAATVSANTQIFGEIAEVVGGGSQAATVYFGVKTDLPQVKKITPFIITGFGGALTSIIKLTTPPTGITGLNATSVTALGGALGFAQEYATGGEYHFKNGLVVGVGEMINKTASTAWQPRPFVWVGKSF